MPCQKTHHSWFARNRPEARYRWCRRRKAKCSVGLQPGKTLEQGATGALPPRAREVSQISWFHARMHAMVRIEHSVNHISKPFPLSKSFRVVSLRISRNRASETSDDVMVASSSASAPARRSFSGISSFHAKLLILKGFSIISALLDDVGSS